MKRNIMSRAVRGVKRNYNSWATVNATRYPDLHRRFQPLTETLAKPKIWATTAALAVITILAVNIATQSQNEDGYAATAPTQAHLWVDQNGGSCQRTPAQAAYSTEGDTKSCSSVDAAWDMASSGDIILIRAGTYGAQKVTGNKTSETKVIGEGDGDDVIFSTAVGGAQNSASCAIGGSWSAICAEGNYMTLENATTITDDPGPYGSLGIFGTNVTVRNVDYYGATSPDGFYAPSIGIEGLNFTLEGGDLGRPGQVQTATCSHGAIEPLWFQSAGDGAVIDGLTIHSYAAKEQAGPRCGTDNRPHIENIRFEDSDNVTIKNTRFKGNTDAGSGHIFTSSSPNNIKFINNVFEHRGLGNAWIQHNRNAGGTPSDWMFAYNSFLDPGGMDATIGGTNVFVGNTGFSPGCEGVHTSNIWKGSSDGTACSGADKVFADLKLSADGHLLAGSPAIDASETPGASDLCTDSAVVSSRDIDGDARPSGAKCDAGADEYSSPMQMYGCIAVPSACGYPDETNTGVPTGAQLTNRTGTVQITQDGTVFQNVNLNGSIEIRANNVTIRNVRLTSGDYYPIRHDYDKTGLLIEDTEINGTAGTVTAGISFGNYTARRVYIHGTADGFKADHDALIEDSYVTGLRYTPATCPTCNNESHNDGLQATGGTNVTVRHSTFKLGAVQGISAIMQIGNEWGSNSNWLVENNLLDGGGWTINMGTVNTNMVFKNNRFTRSHGYGPGQFENTIWTGNYYDNDGEHIPDQGIIAPPDLISPTVSVTSPHDGDILTGIEALTASASDNVGAVRVQFKVCDSSGANCINAGPEDVSSPYTINWDSSSASNGAHVLVAEARDTAGNKTTSANITITTNNDLSAVKSIWTSSDTPVTLASSDTQAVELGMRFKSSIAGTIDGVRFYKGSGNTGTHVGKLWSATGTQLATVTFAGETAAGWQQALFSAPVVITADTTYIVSYYAPSGRYSADSGYFANQGKARGPLQALQNGVSGNNGVYKYGTSGFPTETYSATNYWVDVVFTAAATGPDTTPPETTITSKTTNGTLPLGSITALPTAQFSFVSSEANSTFTCKLDNQPTAACNSGSVSYGSPTALAPGNHTFTVYATDTATTPNDDQSPATFTWTIDQSAPAITLATPTTVRGTITLNATATDNVGVQSVVFSRCNADGTACTAIATVNSHTNNVFTTPWNTTSLNGPYLLKATAADTAGSTTVANTVSITIDNTAPTASITTSPSAVTNLRTASFSFTSTEPTGASFKCGLDNANTASFTPCTSPMNYGSPTPLAAGNHTFYLQTTDAAGNTSATSSFAWIVDLTAPAVSFTSPVHGTTVSGSVLVEATASDTGGSTTTVVGVQFKLDGTNLVTEDTAAPYRATWDTVGKDGSHTLTAIARDSAGNTTTATSVITVNNVTPDTQPPTAPTNLRIATAPTTDSISIAWTASTDTGGVVVGYRVYRDGVEVTPAITATTGFIDTGLTQNTEYSYTIKAIDSSTNASASSTALSVTTAKTPPKGGNNAAPPETPPTTTTTPTTKTRKTGDLDGNDKVQLKDLSMLLTRWGQTGEGNVADLDNSKKVDLRDLSMLLARWEG